MRNLLDFLRSPILIGSFVLVLLLLVGSYFLSDWYYGDTEIKPIPTVLPEPRAVEHHPTVSDDSLDAQLDSLLPPRQIGVGDSELTETESKEEPVELTPEDEAFIDEYSQAMKEDAPRESPHGLGPYPELPSDWPDQNNWDDLEKSYREGHSDIGHELIARVLIKLWKQGKKTDSGVISEDGLVYPLYTDTIYVRWSEDVLDDGTIDRYVSGVLCHGSLAHYDETLSEGIIPSGVKIVPRDGAGIDPYSFLDLQ
jgi:hypothetical protein